MKNNDLIRYCAEQIQRNNSMGRNTLEEKLISGYTQPVPYS